MLAGPEGEEPLAPLGGGMSKLSIWIAEEGRCIDICWKVQRQRLSFPIMHVLEPREPEFRRFVVARPELSPYHETAAPSWSHPRGAEQIKEFLGWFHPLAGDTIQALSANFLEGHADGAHPIQV